MQELIEEITKNYPMIALLLHQKAIDKKYLEKEKEQMFHSFYAGNGVWIDEDFETEFKKYYNQTYSNE
jgi:hypothetical protein